MEFITYYAHLDEQNIPMILHRATPEMQEQVWIPGRGWQAADFLLDVLMGHGDTYPIAEEMARQYFPAEAFLDDNGDDNGHGGGNGDGRQEPGPRPSHPEPASSPALPPSPHHTRTLCPPMLPPDALTWLSQQTETTSSIDDLVEDGWMGCSLEDLIPWLSDREVFERIAAISWRKTAREADGEVALMTADSIGLDGLLEWMLDNRDECPQVYMADKQAEVPAAIPLLRPLATNLPDGLVSEQVVDAEMLDVLAEIFAAVKETFGTQAHLMQFDYGSFAEALREKGSIRLKGEFIDLSDGEIFWFTIDGRTRKLAYQSTGRSDPAFRKELIDQQHTAASTPSAASQPPADLDRNPSSGSIDDGLSHEDPSGGSRVVQPGLYSNDPEVQERLASRPVTDLSLEELLAQGFHGFSLRDLLPRLEADSVGLIYLGCGWVITQPDQRGDAAVMTDHRDDFELLLECLMEEEGDGPTIHAPDETVLPLDALPLKCPTAYNLPEGMRSHEVVDGEFQQLLEEIFKDLQKAYGGRARLYRFDYGAFTEHAENDVIVLTGEFVDLEGGEIYSFTMDGVQQRIRYAETGRIHASMAVCGGTAISRGTAADSTTETTASIP